MRQYILLVGLLFFSAALASAQATGPLAQQQAAFEGWRTFANADTVNVLRAQGDMVWAGTDWGGLVRWDVTKNTFVQLLFPQDRLAGNFVTAITVAPDDTLWVGTKGGISRNPLEGPGQHLNLENTSRRLEQRAVVRERALTDERQVRMLDITNRSSAEATFAPGYLMFGTDQTIYFYSDWDEANQAVVISPPLRRTVEPGTPVYAVEVGLAADDVRDVAVDRAGRVWISTIHGMSVYDSDKPSAGLSTSSGRTSEHRWTVYTTLNSPLVSNDADALAVDGAGRVWISHRALGRLTMFDGGWHTYSIDGTINDLTVRPGDGNVWAATSPLCDATGTCRGGGVWAFDGSTWRQRYREADGIAADDVDTIAFGSGGQMWLGHRLTATNRAVSRWTGASWHVYSGVREVIEADFANILATETPTDLWTVAAGWVWTRHLGAVRGYAAGAGWQVLCTGNTVLNSNKTRAIASDEASRIWVGTHPVSGKRDCVSGGANFWEGKQWAHYTAENGHLLENRVDEISVGRDTVWVKTLTGFSRFSNGEWTSYSGSDIAPMVEADYQSIIDAQDLPGDNDNRLWTIDNANRVWVWGGTGVGYYRPDTGWVRYTFESTLRKKEPAVTFLRQTAPRGETRIWIPAVDLPDNAAAQARFSNGYLMIGDDPTVYRYESFLEHPQADVNGLQISPVLQTQYDVNTPVYAVELGLLSNEVRDAAVGADGRIWFASRPHRLASSTDVYGGVSVLDVNAGTWQQYTVNNTARRDQVVGHVAAPVEARETRVPADFGSANAASQALSAGFVMFGDDPTLYRYMGYSDDDNALIVYPIFNTLKFPAGIQQALSDGAPIYTVELGLLGTPQGDASADRVEMDSSGCMWIAAPGVGISVLCGSDEWTNFQRADDGLPSVQVSGLLARGEEMWVWTDGGGVGVYRNGNWQTYNFVNSGLMDDRVEALAIAPNGEIWIATHDRGISVFTLPGFQLEVGSSLVLAAPGGTGKVYFKVIPVGSFNNRVTVTTEGLPVGVTATAVPAIVQGRGLVELTLNVSDPVAPGNYPFTIIGRSPDGLTTTRQLTLRIVPAIWRTFLPLVVH